MRLLRASLRIAGREGLSLARDRLALLLNFLLPAVLILVFGAAMGAFTGGAGVAPQRLLLVDEDGSPFARNLKASLDTSAALEVRSTAPDGTPLTAAAARGVVGRGRAAAALVVPAGAGAEVAAGRRPALVLVRDAAQEIGGQLIALDVARALFAAAGRQTWRSFALEGMKQAGFPAAGLGLAQLALGDLDRRLESILADAAAGGEPAPASRPAAISAGRLLGFLGAKEELLGGGAAEDRELRRQATVAHAVSGVAVMMLLFGLAAVGGSILKERDEGTLARLLAAPVPGEAILVGKSLAAMALGCAQLLLLFLFGCLVFRLPLFRDPLSLAGISLATVAGAVGFGVLLGAACRTRKQLEGLSTLLILVMSCLGGSWVPRIFMPALIRRIGYLTLNAWSMDGFEKVFWYRLPFPAVLPQMAVLALFALACWGAALLLFRRRFLAR